MDKKNNDIQSQSTRIIIDALQRGGIPVVPVTDEYARRFIREHDRADKAQFRYVGQHLLYSNARRALESIRQEHATPAQWLAMLRKLGGIKQSEDQWTGLSEWLSSCTERTLDKKDIRQYLDKHSIMLHEEHFKEITKTEHFKELQQELDALADSVEENYRQADNEYDAFMDRMKDKYGDEWEYEMSPDESEEESGLLEERDRWDTSGYSAYDIAFDRMCEKYDAYFQEGFHVNRDSLEVYNEADAEHFIADWTIHDMRRECTTQGLDNYHELAFWVEDIQSWNKNDLVHFGEVGNGRCIGWVRFGDTVEKRELTDAELQAQLDAMPGLEAWTVKKGAGLDGADLYFPPGYDASRPFSHILQRKGETTAQYVPYRGAATICHSLKDAVRMYNRLNVPRTEDMKVLVIDEIQSDRHQKGRKNGYRLTEAEMDALKNEYCNISEEKVAYEASLREKYHTNMFGGYVNEDELRTLGDFENRMRAITTSLIDSSKKVERAPFEKNWHELCMKRMLRYAAEEGYDKLVWTTGEQQDIRYNTAKYIDSVRRGVDDDHGRYYQVKLTLNRYETNLHTDEKGRITLSSDGWDGQNLTDVFGKDIAEKMLSMQPKTLWETSGVVARKNKMNQFYDRILPDFVNKYGKRWGVSVKPFELTNLSQINEYTDKPFVMHGIDVTPAMKQSVMQGQPMFMKDRKGQVYGWTLDGTIYLTPRGMNAETGIHEYTHLWAEIMRQKDNPAWEHIKSLLRDTPTWQQVIHDRNYRNLRGDDDRIASEVLARTSGRDNTEKLEQAVRQATGRDRSIRGLEQVKQALGKFWSWVGRHIFNIRQARTVTDVTDRILGDLLRGTKPDRQRPEKTGQVTDTQVRMFGQSPYQVPRLRCRIDGEQQLYVDITRKEFDTLQQEKDPQKREQLQQQLIHKYFADRLHPDKKHGFHR